MILRIKVKGFKNLKETELYFGPFTCIAGPNGVGKSNLFDAIQFLSLLSDNTLIEAATSIRSEKEKKRTGSDIQNLFYHDGEKYATEMEFDVDMIIPKTGTDHLGQKAEATTTYVNYYLKIGFGEKEIENFGQSKNILQIISEELRPLSKIETKNKLKRFGAKNEWINSVLGGKGSGIRQNAASFIETHIQNDEVIIRQDQNQGNKRKVRISTLPRTVLSSANATENPTMLIAKKEMQSWRILQFEPSALRSPDDIELTENPQITENGGHLPATIFRLINDVTINYDVKSQIANRLSELIDDVFQLEIDKDDRRGILTLQVKNKNGTFLPARSLSDGTLRFLALSTIQADPQMQGIISLEEPENGIHPKRIAPMIKLLNDIACDMSLPIDKDNPLRQVIINTHSPLVVAEVPENSLLFAKSTKMGNSRFVEFYGLKNTWREPLSNNHITKGELLGYLNTLADAIYINADLLLKPKERKVIERPEVKQISLFDLQ